MLLAAGFAFLKLPRSYPPRPPIVYLEGEPGVYDNALEASRPVTANLLKQQAQNEQQDEQYARYRDDDDESVSQTGIIELRFVQFGMIHFRFPQFDCDDNCNEDGCARKHDSVEVCGTVLN
jgi:hypothetical protein